VPDHSRITARPPSRPLLRPAPVGATREAHHPALRPPSVELHVASLIVQARPERLGAVEAAIRTLPSAEIPASDAVGKLVVTLETTSDRTIARALDQINATPGVLSATLVYHEVDAVPTEEQEASPCRSPAATT
jgi:periplasmic nitrate reductase NapD